MGLRDLFTKRPAGRAIVTSGEPVMPSGAQFGTAGWLPGYGAPHPSQQIGRFAGTMLNQFPAAPRGVQLHSGREWGNSNWYYPSVAPLPNGSVQQTQRPTNLPGGQREGSRYTGAVGPISVKLYRAAVAAAQVRQTGLSASPWADGLTQ